MNLSWTQNVVILEAGLDLDACRWYLLAAAKHQWTKADLLQEIKAQAHLVVDNEDASTGENQPAKNSRMNTLLEVIISSLTSFFAPQQEYYPQKQKPKTHTIFIASPPAFHQSGVDQIGRKPHHIHLSQTLEKSAILQYN